MAWLWSTLLAVLSVVLVIPSTLKAQNKDSVRVSVGQPSIASKQLTRDAWQMIELLETAAYRPEGREVTYRAEFAPDPKGGTQFAVRLLTPS